MNNKGLIVLCIVAIVALVGWLAALSGRETIEDLTKEIKFLKSENARFEKAASKEPSTVEAVASLAAKCRRAETCDDCGKDMPAFCRCSGGRSPDCFIGSLKDNPGKDAQELGAAVEKKVKEYMEAQS